MLLLLTVSLTNVTNVNNPLIKLATNFNCQPSYLSGVYIGKSGTITPMTTTCDSDIFVIALATLGVAT
jgi:hypothetical protein